MSFGLGTVERKETKCFIRRKGDFDQTLLRVAILDGLCRAGESSSGNQQEFTDRVTPS